MNEKTIKTIASGIKKLKKSRSLPILESVYFGDGSIHATDLDTYIECSDNSIKAEQPFFVSKDIFASAVKEIPKHSSFTVDKDGIHILGIEDMLIPWISTVDFERNIPPKILTKDGIIVGDINTSDMTDAAMHSKEDACRAALGGVFVDVENSTLACTDGTSLYYKSLYGIKQDLPKVNCIIPGNAVKVAKALFATAAFGCLRTDRVYEGDAPKAYDIGMFYGDGILVRFRFVDEQYPNYKQVIPAWVNARQDDWKPFSMWARSSKSSFTFGNGKIVEYSTGLSVAGKYNNGDALISVSSEMLAKFAHFDKNNLYVAYPERGGVAAMRDNDGAIVIFMPLRDKHAEAVNNKANTAENTAANAQ